MSRSNIGPARRGSLLVGGCLIMLALGCKKTGGAAEQLSEAPTMESVTGEAKCGVRASASKPLVVEWPAAERAALEARAARGLVAVRYQGCEMEVLTTCSAKGAYEYVGLTQKREGVKITNADELYAQLPVGAAKLEGKLERSGQLNVDMVIVGRREADRAEFHDRHLEGRCDTATHVVTGLTVGAYTFYAGAAAEVGGQVGVGNVGVGASSASNREVLKADGDGLSCVGATTTDAAPPEGCGALLRVEVVPIDRIFGPSVPVAVDGGPGPVTDPAHDKKIRNAKLMATGGYLGALAGVTVGIYGVAIYYTGKNKLEAEMGAEMVSADRSKNISRARTGQIMTFTGIGVGVLGIGLAVYGQIRLKSLQNARVALSPLLGPGLTGVGLEGRF